MGRTNPTFRDTLRGFEGEWQAFRRALRRGTQEDFDELIEDARRHADAAGAQNPTHPTDAILVSMILSLKTRQNELERRIRELESSEE